MDEPTKAKIRKRARALITAADLVVLVFLVYSVLLALLARQAPSVYVDVKLANVQSALLTSFWDYFHDKVWHVGYFLPPDCASDYPRWAERIHEQMQQPVAVFIRECGQTTWVLKPAGLTLLDDSLAPRLAALDTARWHDTLGAIVLGYCGYGGKVDSLARQGRAFWRVGGNRKWGMYFRYSDAWPAFFNALRTAEVDTFGYRPDPVAERVGAFLNVYSVKRRSPEPTLRAFLDEKEVYRSPMLDTTMTEARIDTFENVRLEYYGSVVDRVYEELLYQTRVPWLRLAILVMVMVVFHICWVWIKKLTAPEVSHG
jgi:hypothetical protein